MAIWKILEILEFRLQYDLPHTFSQIGASTWHAIRPWSVDSLDGGFFSSQFCPVDRSGSKNENKILLALVFFLYLTVGVGRLVKKKKKK